MPTPCTVCLHPDRAAIDRRLAAERVNLTTLAHASGVGRKALERHRDRHLPSPANVPADADADADSETRPLAELARLYDLALDALAAAESATLSHICGDGRRPTASHAAIAGFVNDARQHLGAITQLFVDSTQPRQITLPEGSLLAERVKALLEGTQPGSAHAADN